MVKVSHSHAPKCCFSVAMLPQLHELTLCISIRISEIYVNKLNMCLISNMDLEDVSWQNSHIINQSVPECARVPCIWAKYNNSLTWNKAIRGDDFPNINHDEPGLKRNRLRSWWKDNPTQWTVPKSSPSFMAENAYHPQSWYMALVFPHTKHMQHKLLYKPHSEMLTIYRYIYHKTIVNHH